MFDDDVVGDDETSGDWREQRRDVSRALRRLPDSLRREVERARRSDIRASIVEQIMERVLELARERGLTRTRRDSDGVRIIERVITVDERMILRQLAGERTYLQHVHRLVDEALRTAHLTKLNPVSIESLPPAHSERLPTEEGPWAAESDLRLGTGSALGEAPDAFFLAAAHYLISAGQDELVLAANNGAPGDRVLVLNPAGGAFARAAA